MIGASLQTPTTIRSRPNKLYGEAKATHNVVAVGLPRSLSESRMRQIRTSGCVSSEGWHVQQEKGLPGQESEAP